MGLWGSKVPPDTMKELLSKTRFSRAEIEEWYIIFLEHYKDANDPNKPPAMSRAHFIEENIASHGGRPELWEHLFTILDDNGNGLLEFEEFLDRMSMAVRGTADDRMKWTFKFFDKNRDGYVDPDEMLLIFHWLFELVEAKEVKNALPADQDTPERRVEALFAKFDMDDDGKLTLEEFIEGCRGDSAIMEIMSLIR